MQLVLPEVEAIFPSLQFVHPTDLAPETLPAAQAVHVTAPLPLYLPATQSMHLVCDVSSLYSPGEHLVHEDAPFSEKVPLGHAKHDEAPAAEYFPESHSSQIPAPCAYFPALHCPQPAEPAGEV